MRILAYDIKLLQYYNFQSKYAFLLPYKMFKREGLGQHFDELDHYRGGNFLVLLWL